MEGYQSVPRAELYASIAMVLFTAALPTPAMHTIISDNKAVVDGYNVGHRPGHGNMDDLWERFWAIYEKAKTAGWRVDIRKIKSHTLEVGSKYLTGESIDIDDVPYQWRLGNSYADHWADVASNTVACDQGHRYTVSLNDASGWLISCLLYTSDAADE